MAEQNPWKKQMNQNRNPTTTDSTPPISQFPPQEKITPPWMKNKEPTSTTPGASQPAWMKNNPSNTTNDTTSTPAWMKAKQPANSTTNNDSGSTAPWMKAKQGTNNTPGQLSKPAQQSVSSGPAWMQKKPVEQQQTSSNVPAWKAGGSAFGVDKKKKEQQQRLKKEQQQRERIQRQQEERKRLEKEREEQNERRTRQQMQEQDKLSNEREHIDRQKELQRKRAEQQKKRLQEQQRLKSQSKTKVKSSSKGQVLVRSPPSNQSPVYTQYLYYFTQSLNQSLQYKQKLANQLNLLRVCHNFTSQLEQKVTEIVKQSQESPSKPMLSSAKKNKIINLDELLTQVYYGFCEGQQSDKTSSPQHNPKHPTTQSSIKFVLSQIQRLEKVFHFYNNLTNILCSLSRKHPAIMTKFRAPLFSFLQHKGIAFLAESYTEELLETQAVLPFQLKEICVDFGVVEKELRQKCHYHLAKTDLMVKKVFVEDIQELVYVVYLKNWDFKLSKHAPIPNQVSVEKITTDYYFLTQQTYQKLPLIPEQQFQVFKKVKTHSFSQLSDVLHLAQSVFIVYSSCQGEVDQKEFWELILSESQEIWNLIRCAGYKSKLFKDKRFLFRLFEMYSGVEVRVQVKKAGGKQKLVIKAVRSIKGVYDFARLQVSEVVKNFDKYLKDSRYELAEHSLSLFKELQSISNPIKPSTQDQNTAQINSLTYTLHLSKLLISRQQLRQATKLLQDFIKHSLTLKSNSFGNIPIKIQLLVLYIKLKQEQKILQIFSQLLQIVEFYFGTDSLINATLYQMLGSYYSLKGKQQQASVQTHVITLYEHAVSIVLKFYGDQSESIAQVYLSRAVAFLNLHNFDLFNKDIDYALKIFKSHSRKKDKIAQCLYHKGRAKLLQTTVQAKSQGIQLLEQSSSIYHRISHFSQAIDGFLIVVQILDERIDENMKKIQTISNQVVEILNNSYKSLRHLSRAVSVIVGKLDTQLKGLIGEMSQENKQKNRQVSQFTIKQQEQQQTNERQENQRKLYADFEQIMKGFSTFTEMIKWLGWTAISMAKTDNPNSFSRQKFLSITQLLSALMIIDEKARNHNLDNQQQNDDEESNQVNSQNNEWNQSEQSNVNKSNRSQRGQYSPIGQIRNEENQLQ